MKYARKTEFRRLCDLLRQHLTSAAKYANQAYGIDLNDADTLQRHLDTRFVQLNAATQLELWQEAFRTTEDIHHLLSTSTRPPKPFMMANYYENLARTFMVGENYLFHAAAWNKYYETVRQNKNLPQEEHARIASQVLISALAIPMAHQGPDSEVNKARNQRLTLLLRVEKMPTREDLVKEALGKSVLPFVRSELKQLYHCLEVQFHPLSICQKMAPLMAVLSQDADLQQYVKPLHHVVLTRLLQQV